MDFFKKIFKMPSSLNELVWLALAIVTFVPALLVCFIFWILEKIDKASENREFAKAQHEIDKNRKLK